MIDRSERVVFSTRKKLTEISVSFLCLFNQQHAFFNGKWVFRVNAVVEHDSVEVVDFVLDHDCIKAFEFDAVLFSVFVHVIHSHTRVADYIALDFAVNR